MTAPAPHDAKRPDAAPAGPGGPSASAASASEVALVHRLSTRLTVLLLAVVLVLAAATAVLLWRGLDAVIDAPAAMPADGGSATDALAAVLRGSLVNLAVVVAVTLVAAAAFSRSLLTEPIARLTDATRALAAGDRTVRLRLEDRSELGELARAFDTMADALAEAQDRLEARVAARTAELRALLTLSNTIAVTTDLDPLLAAVLDRLEASGGAAAAEVLEGAADGRWTVLARHGTLPAASDRDPASLPAEGRVDGPLLTVPLRVRERTVGVLRAQARDGGAWDEEPRRLAVAVAAQAAVAIENVRLYERARDEAADDERRHLARELHDSVSQAIYAIVLGAHAAQGHVERDPAKARAALDTVVELAEAALAEMRALIFELRPEALADVGLVGALHRQLDGLELRHRLATERAFEALPDLPFGHQQVLLRVVQEALHNVVKHARAQRVTVRTEVRDGALCVEVADDGVGFDPEGPFPGHLGLTSMRERIGDLGGRLEIDSAPGSGTRLRARLPLPVGREAGSS